MADYNRPDDIPVMPTPPDPTEPRDSFVEKALNVWNWLKSTVPYWNNILTWINDTVLPKVEVAEQIGDMSKYLGEWGDVTSANKGESVSVGDTIYTSKIDNNTDQPPTDNWAKQGVNLDDYTQTINVMKVRTRLGGNTGELTDNQITLTSRAGEDVETSLKINKLDSEDGVKIYIIDKDGNQIGDAIYFDEATKRWILNKRSVLFSGESSGDTGTITVAEPFNRFNFIIINFSTSDTSEDWRYSGIIEKENIVANRRTIIQTEEGNAMFRLNDDLTAINYDLNGSNNIITSIVGYF